MKNGKFPSAQPYSELREQNIQYRELSGQLRLVGQPPSHWYLGRTDNVAERFENHEKNVDIEFGSIRMWVKAHDDDAKHRDDEKKARKALRSAGLSDGLKGALKKVWAGGMKGRRYAKLDDSDSRKWIALSRDVAQK